MKNSSQRHPLIRLWKHTAQYKVRVWLAMFFSILNKIFDLAPPVLIGAAVEIVVSKEDSFLAQWGVVDVTAQLWVLAGVSVLVWAGESLFEYIYSLLWRGLAQSIQHHLRLEAYAHVQDLEMAYFEDRSTGGLMAILNDDINQLERFLDTGANDLIQVVTTVIAVGGSFIVIAPSAAWMALLPMPFVVWGSFAFQKRIAPRYAEVREKNGLLSARFSNNLGGIATIKSFTAEAFEVENIRKESEAYRASNVWTIKLSSAFVPLIRMIIVSGFAAIMIAGGHLALTGVLAVGAYSVLVFMTQRLLWPLTRLGAMLDLYQRAMASTNRVLNLLDTPTTIVDGPAELPLKDIDGALRFENASFRYAPPSRDPSAVMPPTLKNLSLDIPAGKTIAVVGPTGAGKSSLVKLLLRLYDVIDGRITLDGHDLRDLKLNHLRRTIGFVSQDVFLFHGTVRENIAYGTFGATQEEIEAAARVAEAHEMILDLHNGYDTIVGERGQKLSGGQRQRMSIARAVLKDPPVLILDEATSAVDNETEAAIQRSLERIVVDRTTIVIAHRLSTVRNADHIYVLDQGQLVESGRHEELVSAGGLYAALWRVQTGERDRV